VTVTLKITASISGTLTYGTSNYQMTMVNFGNLAVSVLAGTRNAGDLRITTVAFVCVPATYTVSPTKTVSGDGLMLYFTASTTAMGQETLTTIEIYAGTRVLWRYSGLSIPLPAGSTVSFSEAVSA
jgi:hypothetical protein